ncbi:MAG: histidinol dehydrogenase [Moraxellaceae bacterium]|nr:histidinol dehydrogenase [Moraxellaceae bacterium]
MKIYTPYEWQRPQATVSKELFSQVSAILNDIEQQGDSKIDELALQFDGFLPKKITLKPFADYQDDLDPALYDAILTASKRIERFCQFQRDKLVDDSYSDETGEYGFVYQAVDSMGAYIPAGRFPLISTALMTLLPAKVAGVQRRIAVSPSDNIAIQAAVSLAGATEFYTVGGIQAIAMLAYGYKDLQPVSTIVGPGNQYVNASKQLLQHTVEIDGSAGPSELLVIADDSINTDWLIADMAAQAEHDPQALSVVVSDSQAMLERLKHKLLLASIINDKQIVLIQSRSKAESIAFANDFAGEHVMLVDKDISAQDLKHYGSLFIGNGSAVAYGDYCSGPNHTLPTAGSAKRQGGLSVHKFLKVQSVQTTKPEGMNTLSQIGVPLAHAEGLVWHKKSMHVRMNKD